MPTFTNQFPALPEHDQCVLGFYVNTAFTPSPTPYDVVQFKNPNNDSPIWWSPWGETELDAPRMWDYLPKLPSGRIPDPTGAIVDEEPRLLDDPFVDLSLDGIGRNSG